MSRDLSTEKDTHSSPAIFIGTYLVVLLVVVLLEEPMALSVLLLLLVLIGLVSPSIRLKKTLLMGSLLSLGVFLGNLFWGTGRVLLEAGPFVITDGGLLTASVRALRVAVLVLSAKVLFSGRIEKLTAELRWLLGPLSWLGIRTGPFVQAIEETLVALPEVQSRISRRASHLKANGNSRVKAMGLAIYETFLQELQRQ